MLVTTENATHICLVCFLSLQQETKTNHGE